MKYTEEAYQLTDEESLAPRRLDAIDLKVDYLGSAASIEEHGIILESACMSYTETSDAMSCSEAESGAGDDVAIPGSDTTGLDSCVCTLEGVVDYCSAKHTSTNLTTLSACTKSAEALTLYEESNNVAYAINDGSPLWVTINGNEYSFSTNETDIGLASWATQTKRAFDPRKGRRRSASDHIEPL
ncbi:hypothetical protein JL722_13864 [Aureococcus anophagefferens]|nr:hypothetical protein JL722_13864 [Aureococcus anophagefferens]